MDIYSYHEGEGNNKEGLLPLLNALYIELFYQERGEAPTSYL